MCVVHKGMEDRMELFTSISKDGNGVNVILCNTENSLKVIKLTVPYDTNTETFPVIILHFLQYLLSE